MSLGHEVVVCPDFVARKGCHAAWVNLENSINHEHLMPDIFALKLDPCPQILHSLNPVRTCSICAKLSKGALV